MTCDSVFFSAHKCSAFNLMMASELALCFSTFFKVRSCPNDLFQVNIFLLPEVPQLQAITGKLKKLVVRTQIRYARRVRYV